MPSAIESPHDHNEVNEYDYLANEQQNKIKSEYNNGYVYAMAGASENHNLIAKNTSYELERSLRKKNLACDVLASDMKVKITAKGTRFFYPDIAVFCDKHENDTKYYKHSPVIIIEVLSKSTRKRDKTDKKIAYFNIPSLQEYVLIEQDYCEIEVFRKSENWRSTVYLLGDCIHFSSLDIHLSVDDVYYHVTNQDITSTSKEADL
jgi:Uma2 family endonuclease